MNLAEVIKKCMSDQAFKTELMADPKKVLTELGVKVPDGMTVKVVENSSSVFHLVIPSKSSGKGQEMSDAELASAAGGWNPYDTETSTTCCCRGGG